MAALGLITRVFMQMRENWIKTLVVLAQ